MEEEKDTPLANIFKLYNGRLTGTGEDILLIVVEITGFIQ